MPNKEISATKQQIKIHTLGKFFIRRGDNVLSESSSRSRRMWEVFKYLLSHRNKSFFPEEILDRIWPEKNYSDPNTVMRAQMFRLRQALNDDKQDNSLSSNIIFSQGCYRWEAKVNCWIDTDQFEIYVNEGKSKYTSNPDAAIDSYNNAIELYKGEYLPESAFSEWVVPVRAYFHDLYLTSVYDLIELYRTKHANDEIIKLCEQVSSIDYFEEKIHIKLIEALLTEGLTNRARAHYNEVTSAYYRELGVKPSNELKSLYRLISLESGSFELDLGTIQEGLKGKEVVNGAYFCDADLFRYFYKLERLRGERSGKSVLLCLITVTNPDYSIPSAPPLKEVMNNLQE
ncbi:MAG: winged helix-turn-helix domain-containing protein, partial [Firmicutes bacterium]|nr:winged helix-turn-helix domain-containing protein [Bacillota bacterium]